MTVSLTHMLKLRINSAIYGHRFGLLFEVRKMATHYPPTIIVIYNHDPRNWYFAEVEPTACIYRIGPFDSENATREIVSVIYPADLPRETIDAPGDYDDGAILRTAKRGIDARLASHRAPGEARADTSTSWWRLLFGRHAPTRDSRRVLRSVGS